MGSIADRNRELLIQRIEADPRLEGAKVLAAAALMRVSVLVSVAAGVVGALAAQAAFGAGGIQFAAGLAAGYLGYFLYLWRTMKEPRVIGAMSVLTAEKFLLLGSRRAGVVAEYRLAELEDLKMLRKGNLLVMGKLAVIPAGAEPIIFMTANRHMALHLVAEFEKIHKPRQ